MVGFRNNFQDRSRLLKQLLESQAAIGKPERAHWREAGLLEGFSEIVSDFIEASQNFGFPSQKDSKKLWKPSALIPKEMF